MALIRSSGSGGSPCGEPVIVGESLNNFLNSGLSSNELLPFFLSTVVSSDLDSKKTQPKLNYSYNVMSIVEIEYAEKFRKIESFHLKNFLALVFFKNLYLCVVF